MKFADQCNIKLILQKTFFDLGKLGSVFAFNVYSLLDKILQVLNQLIAISDIAVRFGFGHGINYVGDDVTKIIFSMRRQLFLMKKESSYIRNFLFSDLTIGGKVSSDFPLD